MCYHGDFFLGSANEKTTLADEPHLNVARSNLIGVLEEGISLLQMHNHLLRMLQVF